MKVEKKITLFPQPFKSVTLTVSDVIDFDDADMVIAEEINNKYIDLLSDEDLEILRKQNKYIKRK
jgi:hypothetical protein